MSTESFETHLCELMGYCDDSNYATRLCARLKAAHDREIRDVSQQQYHRGFEDGRHSMDAEHRAISMRLRGLRFDGGSHENLSKIAYAIYPCATGWTCESANGLRDKLVDLMGGVSDDTCGAGCCCAAADCDGRDSGEHAEVSDGGAADDSAADSRGGAGGELVHLDGLVAYDVLDNERRKAVCELRKIHTDAGGFVKALANALGVEWQAPRMHQTLTIVRDRLIHLLGGDQPSGIDAMNSYEMRIEKLEQQRDHWKYLTDVNAKALLRMGGENASLKAECERLRKRLNSITEAVEHIKSLGQE